MKFPKLTRSVIASGDAPRSNPLLRRGLLPEGRSDGDASYTSPNSLAFAAACIRLSAPNFSRM